MSATVWHMTGETLPPAENLPLAGAEPRQLRQRKLSARRRQVPQLLAQGLKQVEVAQELETNKWAVNRDLRLPEVQQDLKVYRDAIKRQILETTSDGLVREIVQMARGKVASGEAKDFDAAMRGLNALEKTTASASGEAQKVQLDATVTKVDRRELYGRLEMLVDHVQSTG